MPCGKCGVRLIFLGLDLLGGVHWGACIVMSPALLSSGGEATLVPSRTIGGNERLSESARIC